MRELISEQWLTRGLFINGGILMRRLIIERSLMRGC